MYCIWILIYSRVCLPNMNFISPWSDSPGDSVLSGVIGGESTAWLVRPGAGDANDLRWFFINGVVGKFIVHPQKNRTVIQALLYRNSVLFWKGRWRFFNHQFWDFICFELFLVFDLEEKRGDKRWETNELSDVFVLVRLMTNQLRWKTREPQTKKVMAHPGIKCSKVNSPEERLSFTKNLSPVTFVQWLLCRPSTRPHCHDPAPTNCTTEYQMNHV